MKFNIGELVYSRQPLTITEAMMIWDPDEEEVIADKSDVAIIISEPTQGFGDDMNWYHIRYQKSGRRAFMPDIELIKVSEA